jgi:HAD superfamily hydrolase (TIGR01484 family)
MQKKNHLFFDMDMTVAPSRQPITQKMYNLLDSLEQDIIIVSGQLVDKIEWQSNGLPAIRLGQNGNHAVDVDGHELWNFTLSSVQKQLILNHIEKLLALLPDTPNPDWHPIEDRGGQITFSPVGNTAPVEIKKTYDPDIKKRFALLEQVPFEADDLVVKIGGSTSLDYFHKDSNKGTNVKKLIELKGWNPDECIYYGDGLYPGGNDEAVIGVIETVAVESDEDTYLKLLPLYGKSV